METYQWYQQLYNNLNVFRTGHKSIDNVSFPACCSDTCFVTATQTKTRFEDMIVLFISK
jgi:hypothetical protein